MYPWNYPPPQHQGHGPDVIAIAELIHKIMRKQEKREKKVEEAKKAAVKKEPEKKAASFSIIQTAVIMMALGPFVGLGYLYIASALGAALKRTLLP